MDCERESGAAEAACKRECEAPGPSLSPVTCRDCGNAYAPRLRMSSQPAKALCCWGIAFSPHPARLADWLHGPCLVPCSMYVRGSSRLHLTRTLGREYSPDPGCGFWPFLFALWLTPPIRSAFTLGNTPRKKGPESLSEARSLQEASHKAACRAYYYFLTAWVVRSADRQGTAPRIA